MATIPAVPEKQPLPLNPFDDPDLHAAYEQCKLFETNAGLRNEHLMIARCLGYFLTELPDAGKHMVAEDIIACMDNDEVLIRLAYSYINHIMRLFRQNKGSTPAPSPHPSRPSFDLYADYFSESIEPAPRDHRTAKINALKRDGYRCMVTGATDYAKYASLSPAERATQFFAQTNFCHIFPPSTNWDLDMNVPNDPKRVYAGNVWSYVKAFGGIDAVAELNGAMIHRLSNGLTLEAGLHPLFDALLVWFEAVQNAPPNTYMLCRMTRLAPGIPTTPITFVSSSPALELPNPKYLALHAAVCRVAHMSGAAEYMDKYDRDMEFTRVLAQDGSSSKLLEFSLHRLVLAC